MSTLDQIRHGFQNAIESLAEGWNALRQRASQALTRFTHHPKGTSAEDQLMASASRWGLLAAEIKEEPEQIVVKLEAPGMEADQFEIEVFDDILVVRGEKTAEREQTSGRYYMLERAYGAFERALRLPAPVDESRAEARYRNGVLTIRLPKVQPHGRRKITIQAA